MVVRTSKPKVPTEEEIEEALVNLTAKYIHSVKQGVQDIEIPLFLSIADELVVRRMLAVAVRLLAAYYNKSQSND